MGHPALQVTQEAYDFHKKNGMEKSHLDELEIISKEEMKRQKQIQKEFKDNEIQKHD